MALPAAPAHFHPLSAVLLVRARLVTAARLVRFSLLVLRGRVPVDAVRPVLDHHGCTGCASTAAVPGADVPDRAVLPAAGPSLVLTGVIGLLGLVGSAALLVDDVPAPVRDPLVLPGVRTRPAVDDPAPRAEPVAPARHVAARSRAVGPTSPLWHAVAVDRLAGGRAGACETTVCGALVRLDAERAWPVVERGVCPACAAVVR